VNNLCLFACRFNTKTQNVFLILTKATKNTKGTVKSLKALTAPRLKHEQGHKYTKPPKSELEKSVARQACDEITIATRLPLMFSGLGGFVS
jgi:hypothetical protein